MKMIDAVTTRLLEYTQTIRSSIWKNGVRNVIENIESGKGYEGIIEIWKEVDDSDESE